MIFIPGKVRHCPRDNRCLQPLNYFRTMQYQCYRDIACPSNYKCCTDSCYVHKVCRKPNISHTRHKQKNRPPQITTTKKHDGFSSTSSKTEDISEYYSTTAAIHNPTLFEIDTTATTLPPIADYSNSTDNGINTSTILTNEYVTTDRGTLSYSFATESYTTAPQLQTNETTSTTYTIEFSTGSNATTSRNSITKTTIDNIEFTVQESSRNSTTTLGYEESTTGTATVYYSNQTNMFSTVIKSSSTATPLTLSSDGSITTINPSYATTENSVILDETITLSSERETENSPKTTSTSVKTSQPKFSVTHRLVHSTSSFGDSYTPESEFIDIDDYRKPYNITTDESDRSGSGSGDNDYEY